MSDWAGDFVKDVPSGWTRERIRNRLTKVVGGDWGKEPGEVDGLVDVTVVRVADMSGTRIQLTDPTIRAVTVSSLTARRLTDRTLVLEKSGGGEKQNVGRCAIVGSVEGEAICSNFMAALECSEKVDPSFLNYVFSSLYSSDLNYPAIKQTTGIQNLDVTAYLSIHAGFPPVPEQQRIAMYLDASCRAIDGAANAKQEQIDTLKVLRRSAIQHAVTRGIDSSIPVTESGCLYIDKLPVGWRVERLKRIANVRYGLGQPPAELDGGVAMIRATNVDAGVIREEKLLFVDPAQLPLGRNPYLCENEIIVVRSGAYTADSAIVPKTYEGAVAGYDMVVKVTRAHPRFVSYSLLSSYVLNDQLLPLTLRAAQPHLNAEELGSVAIALPPSIEEQRVIAAHLDVKLAAVDDLAEMIRTQIDTLSAYRKSLIHECVTGQRRITEADLARVQAHA